MMRNFDPKTARLILIISGVLLIFALVINHAYKYLPQDDNLPNIYSVEDINSSRDYVDEPEENHIVENRDFSSNKSTRDDLQENEDLGPREFAEQERAERELISELENNNSKSTENSFSLVFDEAKQAFNKKDYSFAIDKYKQAISLTSNKQELALCYDDLAKIYASQRKFGSAISFAQKAYNSHSTAEREVFLARLNYKVGNTQRADELLKHSLQRDFEY